MSKRRASRVLPGVVLNPAPPGWCAGDRSDWRLITEPAAIVEPWSDEDMQDMIDIEFDLIN